MSRREQKSGPRTAIFATARNWVSVVLEKVKSSCFRVSNPIVEGCRYSESVRTTVKVKLLFTPSKRDSEIVNLVVQRNYI